MPNWSLYLIPIVVALSPGQVPMEIRPMQLEMNRVLFLPRNLWEYTAMACIFGRAP